MKLAARGITIIIADGDTGAGDLGPPPMSQTSCDILHPDWPSQSPYVTAISSTYLTPRAQPICYLPASEGGINCLEQPMGEVVTGMTQGLFWGSGGGFSAVTKRASWQEDMVSAYLKKADLLPPAAMYNAGGRACECPTSRMRGYERLHASERLSPRSPLAPSVSPSVSAPSCVVCCPYQTPTPSPSATT